MKLRVQSGRITIFFQYIMKFGRSLLPKRSSKPTRTSQATVIDASQHGIRAKLISENAINILNRLIAAGYEAYLVGGGVRDLLLNKKPKDFDLVTNATPEEIKALFHNCRIIGSRFRLAHVYFGRQIIEVATFRSNTTNNTNVKTDEKTGLILRDNTYGTLEEDAARRDFTVNALYYRAQDNAILDFANGVQALEQGQLILIGDPSARYREDPVRMLRAIRFSVKLALSIDTSAAEAISTHAHLLKNIPSARLFEEVQKLFLNDCARETFDALLEYKVFEHMFPSTADCISHQATYLEMTQLAMDNTNIRVKAGKYVTPAFLFAVLLWGPLQNNWRKEKVKGTPFYPAYQIAIHKTLATQVLSTSIPKRFSKPLREIWELQLRLPKRKTADKIMEHPRFRAAYDFLLLREGCGELNHNNLGTWWTDYQEADATQRVKMIEALPNNRRTRRKKVSH